MEDSDEKNLGENSRDSIESSRPLSPIILPLSPIISPLNSSLNSPLDSPLYHLSTPNNSRNSLLDSRLNSSIECINFYQNLIYQLPNQRLIELGKKDFEKSMELLPISKICSVLLEMNHLKLGEKIPIIPNHILEIVLNLISDDIFLLICHKLKVEQLKSIIPTLEKEKLIILFKSNLSNDIFIKLFPLLSRIQVMIISPHLSNIHLDLIGKNLKLKYIKDLIPLLSDSHIVSLAGNIDDVSLIEKIIFSISIELIPVFIKSLNYIITLKIIDDMSTLTSEELDSFKPTFLQVCIGLTSRVLRIIVIAYISELTLHEKKIVSTLIPDYLTSLFIGRLHNNEVLEIIPHLTPLQVRDFLEKMPDEIITLIIPILSEEQLFFSFATFVVRQFWLVVPLLTSTQFWKIIPVITYDQKQSFINNLFGVDREEFGYHVENYLPYMVAIGLSLDEIGPVLLSYFPRLNPSQIWMSVPVLKSEDIITILPKLETRIVKTIIQNLTQNQIFDLTEVLGRQINSLFLLESEVEILYSNTILLVDKIQEKVKVKVKDKIEFKKLEKLIQKLSKSSINLYVSKDIFKKKLFVHESLIDIIIATDRNIKIIKNISEKSKDLFKKINDINYKINNIDGILSSWEKLKNQNKYDENPEEVIDEAVCFNNNKVWEIYNKVKETFIKIFENEEKLSELGLSWEDLIQKKLFSPEDYTNSNIKTLKDLKKFYLGSDTNI